MGESNKKDDKSTWAIGGGLLMGMGVGFFFPKGICFIIYWKYVYRIRSWSCDNYHNFKKKIVKTKH